MANAEKVAAVEELTDLFRNSSSAVVTEYRGLTVEEITELRRDLCEHATYDVAKVVRDLAKKVNKLGIKGGYMEGQHLEESDVIQLADLESRETLLSMMAGAMKGSLSKAAATFQAPIEKAVRLTEALREKQDE